MLLFFKRCLAIFCDSYFGYFMCVGSHLVPYWSLTIPKMIDHTKYVHYLRLFCQLNQSVVLHNYRVKLQKHEKYEDIKAFLISHGLFSLFYKTFYILPHLTSFQSSSTVVIFLSSLSFHLLKIIYLKYLHQGPNFLKPA